jgi:hypothetical protein
MTAQCAQISGTIKKTWNWVKATTEIEFAGRIVQTAAKGVVSTIQVYRSPSHYRPPFPVCF